jgi:hypothetical protein
VASKSLGPFPKTYRWREIVEQSGACGAPDELLQSFIGQVESLVTDPEALKAITFLVALPVCSRNACAAASMNKEYGIQLEGEPILDALLSALHSFADPNHPAVVAAARTVRDAILQSSSEVLFDTDDWRTWRAFDGPAFCDLAVAYFASLNEEMLTRFLQEADSPTQPAQVFAREAAIITRSFSARWFNACARYETPPEGSIRWYLGHCLGKVDLELNRELSDWVEPLGNPWKRKKKGSPLECGNSLPL